MRRALLCKTHENHWRSKWHGNPEKGFPLALWSLWIKGKYFSLLTLTPFRWNSSSIHWWSSHQRHWFLLDLSAAFDIIDHSILIICLSSWFRIHGSVLKWFKCYSSSRSFWDNVTTVIKSSMVLCAHRHWECLHNPRHYDAQHVCNMILYN